MSLSTSNFTGQLVEDETTKPSPTEFPALLPTLQTVVGMVTDGGAPRRRNLYRPPETTSRGDVIEKRASELRALCPELGNRNVMPQKKADILANLEACSLRVTKSNLLDFVRYEKRLDMEQAVAMVIAYLSYNTSQFLNTSDKTADEFERDRGSVLQELLADPGVTRMINETCMWREPAAFSTPRAPRKLATINKKHKILQFLGLVEEFDDMADHEFASLLQTLRRRRVKLGHSQHLTMPPDLISGDASQKRRWGPDNTYQLGRQDVVPNPNAQIISRIKFKKIQRLLHSMLPPADVTSRFVYDVEQLIQSSGAMLQQRVTALETSEDPYALAYSFVAAQRNRQLKVVSDRNQGHRFLVKGESSMILQNRPDVLTSFDDILVRHAHDLKALTAIRCPQGVRDHFSTQQEIKDRAQAVCEMMERYVKDFGEGRMEKLTFQIGTHGGSGRGPVDLYNALCDQLRDCEIRAKAVGMDLEIGRVHKFLAKDIMSYNSSWSNDAFAGGKVPGWVEYLARVRAEEIGLDD